MALELNAKSAMVMFIAFIMVGSTIGYVFLSGFADSAGSSLKYGAYSFERTRDGLRTTIEGKNYAFLYSPSEVAELNMSEMAASKLKNARIVYATSDFQSENKEYIASAVFALSYALQQKNIVLITGFTNDNISVNAPRISCANATQYVPVIYFEDANVTEMDFEENCFYLKAQEGEGFLMEKDRLLYGLLGVIQSG